jgi:hypothetical protein
MKRVAIVMVLTVLASLGVADAQAPGRWVKLAAFPEPAEELYGAAAGGKVYVFGGLAPGMHLHSDSHDAFEFAER